MHTPASFGAVVAATEIKTGSLSKRVVAARDRLLVARASELFATRLAALDSAIASAEAAEGALSGMLDSAPADVLDRIDTLWMGAEKAAAETATAARVLAGALGFDMIEAADFGKRVWA